MSEQDKKFGNGEGTLAWDHCMSGRVPNGNTGPIAAVERQSVRDVEIGRLEWAIIETGIAWRKTFDSSAPESALSGQNHHTRFHELVTAVDALIAVREKAENG